MHLISWLTILFGYYMRITKIVNQSPVHLILRIRIFIFSVSWINQYCDCPTLHWIRKSWWFEVSFGSWWGLMILLLRTACDFSPSTLLWAFYFSSLTNSEKMNVVCQWTDFALITFIDLVHWFLSSKGRTKKSFKYI